MTAIIRVPVRDVSPMFSSQQSRLIAISLPAAPWDTPYVKPDNEETIGQLERARRGREALLAFVRANPGCDYEACMAQLGINRGQFDGYMRVLMDNGIVKPVRAERGGRNKYYAQEVAA